MGIEGVIFGPLGEHLEVDLSAVLYGQPFWDHLVYIPQESVLDLIFCKTCH